MTIAECWVASKMAVLLHNLMSFVGSLAISASLLIAASLSPAEIAAIIVPTVLAPVLLLGMAYYYFYKIHPWAMLLDADQQTNSVVPTPKSDQE